MNKRNSRKKKQSKSVKSKRKSPHQKWLAFLRKKYGLFEQLSKDGLGIMIQYQSDVPPTMPRPSGPSLGAQLTIKQLVNSFTVATGVSAGVITQNSATAVLGDIAFTLSDLAQVSTLTSLFDQYRIEEVQLRIRPHSNAISTFTLSAATEAVPYMLWVIDRDDSSVLGTLTQLQEYDQVRQVEGYESLDIILRPSIAPAVFAAGAFSGYGIEESEMWIDCSNTAVPHYGCKFGINALDVSTTASWKWEVCAWYKVSFKNVR